MEFSTTNSFYFCVREDRPIDMSLQEFVEHIRGERWEKPVAEYQQWLAAGEKEKAKAIKNAMPGMIIAGRAVGTHALNHMCALSGDAMFDIDEANEQTESFVATLRQWNCVRAVFRSISHRGLKVVVRIEAENGEEYATAYALVAEEISRRLHFPCDLQCKNLSRPCYASHVPAAFFNAEAVVYDWRTPAAQRAAAHEKLKACPTDEELPQQPRTTPAAGFIHAFFEEFLASHPFVEGERNRLLLKLGRLACYKGFSLNEVEKLIAVAVEKLAENGCQPADIASRIAAGYRYAGQQGKPGNDGNRVHRVHGPYRSRSENENTGQDIDDEYDKGEKLRQEAPRFPDEIFQNLPDILQRGLTMARNKLERDMLLMGMLANIGACLPGVKILYARKYYSPHLYFIAIAPPATGKGVLTLAATLPQSINNYLLAENAKKMRKYKSELAAWELEKRRAAMGKRIPDMSKEPEEPAKTYLCMPGNTSKSQLILMLETCGRSGLIINASELDTLTSALHQDCGQHSDLLRACYEHEEVSSCFKVDGRPIVVHAGYLAICASGTPAQLLRYISSQEDGLWSRHALLTLKAPVYWISAAPDEEAVDAKAFFQKLADELLEGYLYLLDNPTEVKFTPVQWDEHTLAFSRLLNEVIAEGDDTPAAIVYRGGVIQARIAAILTALRKLEARWRTSEYVCSDEDFHTAMKITHVLIDHSLLLTSSLRGEVENKKPLPLKPFRRAELVLEGLHQRFTYTEFLSEAIKQSVSRSTSKRLLTHLLAEHLIDKEEDSYVKLNEEKEAGGRG
ncbi:MAG: DUF3987 domain-containing protein [Bacteroides sp.]